MHAHLIERAIAYAMRHRTETFGQAWDHAAASFTEDLSTLYDAGALADDVPLNQHGSPIIPQVTSVYTISEQETESPAPHRSLEQAVLLQFDDGATYALTIQPAMTARDLQPPRYDGRT